MRLKFSFAVAFLLLLVGTLFGQSPTSTISGSRPVPVGVNIPALLPRSSSVDFANAESVYKQVPSGACVRWGTYQWEVETASLETKWKGIDGQLDLMHKYGVTKAIVLLEPTRWQDPDHWVPSLNSIPDRMVTMDAIVSHIVLKASEYRIVIWYQLLNEPAGRCVNPPLSEKPGGSNRTEHGEWHPDLYALMNAELDVLDKYHVPYSRRVSPAISCVLDGNTRSVAELMSVAKFDWSRVGTIAFNIGGSASWATEKDFPKLQDRLDQLRFGFANNAGTMKMVIDGLGFAKKNFIITEFYGGPARFAMKLNADGSFNTDVSDICEIEVEEFMKVLPSSSMMTVWNGPSEGPGNPWLWYRVWDTFLSKLKSRPAK